MINFRKWLCKFAKGWLYKACDCFRYEDTKIIEPTIPDGTHIAVIDDPEPEPKHRYLWVDICTESGKRARKWCIKRECVMTGRFVKGEQPTEWCGKHKRPQKALKQAHYGGLGMLLWFMHGSWKPKDLELWTGYLNRTVERIRREGFSVVDFFVWICDGRKENWYANKKIPFKIVDGKVDFDAYNPKWWRRFNVFIETLHRWGLEPSMLTFSRYNGWAFKNAKQGPMDFWGVMALAYQIDLVRSLTLAIQGHYGSDYMPWIKANNELNCRNNNEKGALRATWYVDLFDGIQDLFPEKDDVSKWILNTDKCEWIVFPFAYDETKEFRGYKLGQSRFLRDGRRMYVDEMHRMSCPENITDGRVDAALRANFPNKTPQRYHEDCGCGSADGKLIGKGAGIGQYHVGNNQQTFQAQKLLHSKYKAKNRSAISAYMPLDCLKKTPGRFLPESYTRYMVVDPAGTDDKQHNCPTGIVVCDVNPAGTIFILHETKGVYMEFMKESELDWGRVKAFIRGIRAGLK